MTASPRSGDLVRIDERAIAAWPFLPAAALPASWWIGPTGERVRVNVDGSADELGAPGHPRGGAASHPCNGRRA